MISILIERSKGITTTNEQENQERSQSSFLGMLNNPNPMPFNSYYYSEPNTFSIGTEDSKIMYQAILQCLFLQALNYIYIQLVQP